MPADDLILFSGYARLPKGVSASFRHETLALVVLLDMKTLTIVEAECTLSTKTSEHYVAGILIGYSFNCGIEDVCRRIDQYYDGYAKKLCSPHCAPFIRSLAAIDDRKARQ